MSAIHACHYMFSSMELCEQLYCIRPSIVRCRRSVRSYISVLAAVEVDAHWLYAAVRQRPMSLQTSLPRKPMAPSPPWDAGVQDPSPARWRARHHYGGRRVIDNLQKESTKRKKDINYQLATHLTCLINQHLETSMH